MRAIEVKGVTKSFGKVVAAKNLCFSVEKGEIFGLLGPNGAGKTTTIKMLVGLLQPDQGEMLVFGEPPYQRRGRAGVVFDRALYERLTARENLLFFRSLYPRGLEVDDVLQIVGLKGQENRPVKGFSKGMKQRLELARALINDPDILFLDEPTVGLDPVGSRAVHRIIQELNKMGKTIILTTHYMEEADRLCDRIAFIAGGEIRACDSVPNLKSGFGQRQVEILLEGEAAPVLISMDQADLHEVLSRGNLVSIHSQEASLEDVFIAVTGRELHE